MAKLASTIINGFVQSKNFITGALGSGWRIALKLGRWVLEIDDLVVRGRMTVFELLIQKIRAVKGALGITQANGKIKEVREDDVNYYIKIEDEMSFVANDIIRCQTFSSGQKSYWVIVSSTSNNEIVIPKSEFEGWDIPAIGDEIVQFGNTTDTARQSAIYLHADEGGDPAIDVLFGIHEKNFNDCTKVRIGGGIPGAEGCRGFYCENGMIKSVNEVGEIMYMLRPDGSGLMAKGNISWDADGNGSIFNRSIYWDKDGFHLGSGIKLTWDNLPADAKEALKGGKGDPGDKGDPGKDANLLPWVEEWNNNKTEIGGEHVISPKIFSGTRGVDGKLTGVAVGRDVIEIDGVKKTGIFGIKDGVVIFSVDENGDSFYGGSINVNDRFSVDKDGKVVAVDGSFSGKLSTPFFNAHDKDMWNEVIKDHYNIFSYILSASSLYIVLPVGKEFNGVRINVMNFDPYNRNFNTMTPLPVRIEWGGYIRPGSMDAYEVKIINTSNQLVDVVEVPPGKIAEFIGVGDGDALFAWKVLGIV